jgi:predicted AAA+ superfamily ATPase
MALKPWYKVVTPREDLREGRAPADYRQPERFFERTYLMRTMGDLAANTVRRLSGIKVETSAVFNLSTQFGGGKTHALLGSNPT